MAQKQIPQHAALTLAWPCDCRDEAGTATAGCDDCAGTGTETAYVTLPALRDWLCNTMMVRALDSATDADESEAGQ